ncbi:hypothetical protein IMPR6_490001 [Imperialibacter sp. EC-SDR9]|nr:hypothetical protein IMPERIA75_440021 [Imperialibacter sp. 75]CAD5293717.1 hypothetical protein IMPERIA89_650001 [Imperialibacter sp. 89]VVT29299.1 hypothetical protein IMPR6_490001 [Imperialibacter sp. EC-SDR9]
MLALKDRERGKEFSLGEISARLPYDLSSINKTLKYWGGKIDKTSALVYI